MPAPSPMQRRRRRPSGGRVARPCIASRGRLPRQRRRWPASSRCRGRSCGDDHGVHGHRHDRPHEHAQDLRADLGARRGPQAMAGPEGPQHLRGLRRHPHRHRAAHHAADGAAARERDEADGAGRPAGAEVGLAGRARRDVREHQRQHKRQQRDQRAHVEGRPADQHDGRHARDEQGRPQARARWRRRRAASASGPRHVARNTSCRSARTIAPPSSSKGRKLPGEQQAEGRPDQPLVEGAELPAGGDPARDTARARARPGR